jgi:hypothetical protein
MKPVYLGAVKGYQSAVYRPGVGWTSGGDYRRSGRQPALFKKSQSMYACPVSVVQRRRPGIKTKVAIVSVVAVVAALLALVLYGGVQL